MTAADMALEPLIQQLRAAHRALREAMWSRWQRDLPLEELLFDRWERARTLGFGEGASIYHSSYVYGEVKVGAHTWIGPMTVLEGSGGITIGGHCSISAGVHIYTHDSVAWALTGGQAGYERSPVSIGDCTYVGSQSVISKGVTLGDHVVIGACSFVNQDIPPYSVAAGVPCKIIGRVVVEGSSVQLVYANE